jgi:hypothetical protein
MQEFQDLWYVYVTARMANPRRIDHGLPCPRYPDHATAFVLEFIGRMTGHEHNEQGYRSA